jgi:cell division protein ZapA (FtsZ GTPase activity inhibitor)
MLKPVTSVVVNIHGKSYDIALGPGQTPEGVRQVAQLVDEGMREVETSGQASSALQTAVLAGLNLVDVLFKLQSEYRTAESEIGQRASRLASSLGRLLEQDQLGILDPVRPPVARIGRSPSAPCASPERALAHSRGQWPGGSSYDPAGCAFRL